MLAIDVQDIHKKFDAVTALNGVSLSVPEGSLTGLIGADGAGKTTLIRILATLVAADKGKAMVLGHDAVTSMSAIRSGIGYMPQRFSLYQDLSVRENLLFFADVFGISPVERNERMIKLLSFSRLSDFQDRRAGRLSGGMKQKLALCCALIHTPRLLILDEPTTGVDPVSRKEFWDILFDLRRQGIAILASTPYMDEAALCDTLYLLHRGTVLRSGSPRDLIAGYPHLLYEITSTTGGISLPLSAPLPPGIALIYPCAGTLHAAVCDRALQPQALLSTVREFAPSADAVALAEPGIEDLLFALLSENGAS
jgi:ABC-2 type transport system ATP-binding protein